MIIHVVLLVTAIVFLLFDMLWGIRRGFFPAILRFVVVCAGAVLAFWLSAPLCDALIYFPLPFADGQNFQELYEGFLLAQEGLDEALSLSMPVRQLVYFFPEALMREFAFVIVFSLYRLVTWPVTAILSRILFGKKDKKRPRFFRSGGMLVGFAQAVVCLAVFMVPFFGFVEFGERFDAAFQNSQNTDIAEVTTMLENNVLDPIHTSPVSRVMEGIGMKRVAIWVFHNLSTTTMEFSDETKTIDYFTYLEDMFPAVSALIMMKDMDPEHMTDRDYENLVVVLDTAKSKEEITQAVVDTVETVVTEFVNEDYRETANVIVETFADKIFTDEGNLTGELMRAEIDAVKSALKVMETATSESAESAFSVVPAEQVVNEILETEYLYETVIEVSEDEEKKERIQADLVMNESQKALAKQEIEAFRATSAESRTPEELQKIYAITDALARMLDLTLSSSVTE